MNDVLVVKIGGGANVDTAEILRDLAEIAREQAVVVVHGVSERMAQLSANRGLSVQMLQSPDGHSSRYTPAPVRDLFVEAAAQINGEIAYGLSRLGVNAHGLTQQVVIQGERKTAIRAVVDGRVRMVRDDYTGRITGVDGETLTGILRCGEVAVVPPFAASSDGLLNVDGDRAAAAVAAAVRAHTLVIMSNVRGLYRHFPDESSFVSQVQAGQINEAMNWAQGRMKRKVLGAGAALESGVRRVVIGDGRVMDPVSRALAGEGTVFTS
ncbi:MAG: [LysW]-aminoadipate kinase [Anaerolineaceae bacterium]|nr:[LysW]-aminoadipate kinase [Anaerolineaceae bacterium]